MRMIDELMKMDIKSGISIAQEFRLQLVFIDSLEAVAFSQLCVLA